MTRIFSFLFAPTHVASIAIFRIAFGAIMFWEVIRYYQYGWISRYYMQPDFFFSYPGFGFLSPLDGNGMYIHFMLLGVLSLFIMLGLFYRVSMALFFLGFTYFFLLDKTNYLNHFYLVSLISFLMIFIPAHRNYALDALIWPSKRADYVPAWALWLLRFQVGVAYFYGGIAKLNADWLQGEPMRMWLLDRTNLPVLGALFDHPWAAYFFSYGGLFLDLLIVPLLLNKKTRLIALIPLFSFHLLNAYLFNIGIFPWFMIASTVLFFEPGTFAWAIKRFFYTPGGALDSIRFKPRPALMVCLALYASWQLLFPLRHVLYPGNVSWTEEGHRFSWHMKLRSKDAEANFVVRNVDTSTAWTVVLHDHLTRRQRNKMPTHPDMILQFAHYLHDYYASKEEGTIEVYAMVRARLNGREPQLLIDPDVNLAAIDRYSVPADWIIPLQTELFAKPEPRIDTRQQPGTVR